MDILHTHGSHNVAQKQGVLVGIKMLIQAHREWHCWEAWPSWRKFVTGRWALSFQKPKPGPVSLFLLPAGPMVEPSL